MQAAAANAFASLGAAGALLAAAFGPAGFGAAGGLPAFQAVAVPSIGVRAYLARIAEGFGCSESCYLLAVVYVDRLVKKGYAVDERNIHRLMLAAVLAAAKYHDDPGHRSISDYARVGGVTPGELLTLELEFLARMGWRLHVPAEEFAEYARALGVAVALPPPLGDPAPFLGPL